MMIEVVRCRGSDRQLFSSCVSSPWSPYRQQQRVKVRNSTQPKTDTTNRTNNNMHQQQMESTRCRVLCGNNFWCRNEYYYFILSPFNEDVFYFVNLTKPRDCLPLKPAKRLCSDSRDFFSIWRSLCVLENVCVCMCVPRELRPVVCDVCQCGTICGCVNIHTPTKKTTRVSTHSLSLSVAVRVCRYLILLLLGCRGKGNRSSDEEATHEWVLFVVGSTKFRISAKGL